MTAAASAGPCLTARWDLPFPALAASDAIVCRRIEWVESAPPDASEQGAAADATLSPAERVIWSRMHAVPKRRIEWLFGRVVAKDAVRRLVQQRKGLMLAAAEVEIHADAFGRPLVQLPPGARCELPAVSISHSRGLAIALAAADPRLSIGIDIEVCADRRVRFESIAFTSAERRLVDRLPEQERREWHLRLWCAKEAAGKALGRGLMDGPHGIEATAVRVDAGTVHLTPHVVRRGARVGESLVAHTARTGDYVSAVVLQRLDAGSRHAATPGASSLHV